MVKPRIVVIVKVVFLMFFFASSMGVLENILVTSSGIYACTGMIGRLFHAK